MITVLLSLGSNLRPQYHLHAAIDALRARFDDIVLSGIYHMPAVGFDGPPFLNAAALLRTDLELSVLDHWLHALEDKLGRDRRGPRFSNRTLDIDIVFYGDRIVHGPGQLRIPRPELKHAFVLKPLAEIAPDFIDPCSKRTLAALWASHPQYGETFERVLVERQYDTGIV
ncbi:MAG: 2-amino-4-hydroxy-6-hydroxymethyldihydropteridine diphosphokinase [Xanthomonadaceae bacterium]|jgi:2-amino-4-hydroxy-6-hydroxymethyldihydropteridine diphosphokinase|nr:2-amino-4-hydroxy-6-hydroxymethyldihydropteridine diphosphokinase [Xanthomonadaceae bacterium]